MTLLPMKHLLRGIAATVLLGFASLAGAAQPAPPLMPAPNPKPESISNW